jgi:hypothetical protein
VIALSPLSPKTEIDLPPLRRGAMWVIRRQRSNIAKKIKGQHLHQGKDWWPLWAS